MLGWPLMLAQDDGDGISRWIGAIIFIAIWIISAIVGAFQKKKPEKRKAPPPVPQAEPTRQEGFSARQQQEPERESAEDRRRREMAEFEGAQQRRREEAQARFEQSQKNRSYGGGEDAFEEIRRKADEKRRRETRDEQRRQTQRQAQVQAQRQQAAQQRQQQAQHDAQQQAQRQAARTQVQRKRRPRRPQLTAEALRRWLQADTLQREYILTEIFQKPVGLRDPDERF